jgi:hypothetical protein
MLFSAIRQNQQHQSSLHYLRIDRSGGITKFHIPRKRCCQFFIQALSAILGWLQHRQLRSSCLTGYFSQARIVFVVSTSTTLAWKLAARSFLSSCFASLFRIMD